MSETQATNWLCEKCGELRSSQHEENMCARVAELKTYLNGIAHEMYAPHEWDESDYKTLRAEILGEFKNRNDAVKRAKDLEYEIERLKTEVVGLKELLNTDANDALNKWLNTSAQMAPLIVRLQKAEDELWQYKKTNADLHDKNERLEEQVKDGWKSPDAVCQELNAAKKEIERLKKRQLPDGWHVGKMRNGDLVPLFKKEHLYLVMTCQSAVDYGGFSHFDKYGYFDIIEIDGVTTKAGEG